MRKNIFNNCLRIAREKLSIHPEYENYPHYTFIIQNNNILGYGYNMKGEPPKEFGYHTRLNGGLPKLHSEFVAYKKIKGILNNEEFEILNIRLNRQGKMKLSHPCSCCLNFLIETKCKNIYYSTENGYEKYKK